MSARPRFPNPPELVLPLRDMLRGVRQTTLEPLRKTLRAVDLVPSPVQNLMEYVSRNINEMAHLGLEIPGEHEIALSAAILSGRQETRRGSGDIVCLARVFAYGLQIVLCSRDAGTGIEAGRARGEVLFSETLLGIALDVSLRDSGVNSAPGLRAARVYRELTRPDPAWNIADLSIEPADQRRAVAAVLLWLLAERADPNTAETRLLMFAQAMSDTMDESLLEAGRNMTALAEVLTCHAAMI